MYSTGEGDVGSTKALPGAGPARAEGATWPRESAAGQRCWRHRRQGGHHCQPQRYHH